MPDTLQFLLEDFSKHVLDRPAIIGICGAQGSGKSTLARKVVTELQAQGQVTQSISLDDFYLSKSSRNKRAKETHPLFSTRGVPGTHDLPALRLVLEKVRSGKGGFLLPRFDKLADEPCPANNWRQIRRPLDVLVLEGWCLGAISQQSSDMIVPVNDLEKLQDPTGKWRSSINEVLEEEFQQINQEIDRLYFLKAPDFQVVHGWRLQQETEALQNKGAKVPDTLKAEIGSFIQYFERITRNMLSGHHCADVTLQLNRERKLVLKGPYATI